MRPEIVPFREEHLNAAAELLAARHRADRARTPELPERFEKPGTVRALLRAQRGRDVPGPVEGVAALRGGRLAGFLLGTRTLPVPSSVGALYARPRSISIGLSGHAVEPEGGFETYREMYAAAAATWVAEGFFSHYIDVPAGDAPAREAWFSLGFGQDIAAAVRDTAPVTVAEEGAAGVEIHRAGPEDIDTVMELGIALERYHAGPPIFFPYLPETEGDSRRLHRDLLQNPELAQWVAYRDGRPVGLQVFQPPWFFPEMAVPERCLYLYEGYTAPDERGSGVGTAMLARSMAWAREAGYERCALHFMAANLTGARFWQGHGFRPVQYRLARHVDERVAWAR